jgi:predicted ATPase
VVIQFKETDALNASLRHFIELMPERPQHPRPFFVSEIIENEHKKDGEESAYFYFKNTPSHPPTLNLYDLDKKRRYLSRDVTIGFNESVISQLKDPSTMPEISALGDLYREIAIYKDWSFGRHALGRQLQRADLPVERMLPDASNLALFLNHLRGQPGIKRRILEVMSSFYEGFDDFGVTVFSNTVQLYFEEGDVKTPAVRLSDGTMRFLFLAAILLDPTPPPIICIEEPELGLHPDSIVMLAKLLIEASERTQLIITTHSDVLIDALSAMPEAVVVCERYAEGTFLRRLNAETLRDFLQDYSLGGLWRSGHIGGNRW